MDNATIAAETEISPQMTLLEIMYRWRASEAVFRAYENQAGVCLRCQALFDTLEDAARKYRLDLEGLRRDLQTLIHTLPPPAREYT